MVKKKHKKRTHYDLSPSQSDRWLVCGGSVNLIASADIEEEEDTDLDSPSNRGTAAHEMLEHALNKGISPFNFDKVKFNGRTIEAHNVEAVDSAWTYIRKVAKGGDIYTELEVPIACIGGSGHLDAAVMDEEDALHVFDYKNGRHLVSPKDNAQMKLYALGMMANFHKLKATFPVVLHIVQPMANSKVAEKWATTVGDLKKWALKVEKHVAKIRDGTARFNPGAKQCYWCPVKAECPALAKKAIAEARMDHAEKLGIEDLEQIDLEVIGMWLATVRERLSEALAAGYKSDNWKLVYGSSPRRSVQDAHKAIIDFKKRGYDLNQVAPRMLAPLSVLDKVVGEKDLKRHIILKKSDTPTLARSDDERDEFQL